MISKFKFRELLDEHNALEKKHRALPFPRSAKESGDLILRMRDIEYKISQEAKALHLPEGSIRQKMQMLQFFQVTEELITKLEKEVPEKEHK